MKIKFVSALLAFVTLLFTLTACNGDGADTSPGVSSEEAASVSDPIQASDEEGDLGDYHVKILDTETGLMDYDGNKVIGIRFEFTNHAEEAISFDSALYALAYQDGVELDSAYPDETSAEYRNIDKNIKQDVTITCEEYFVLTSDKSNVEAEVGEVFSLSNRRVTKTFALKQ